VRKRKKEEEEEEETTGQKYNVRISATQGGHNQTTRLLTIGTKVTS